MSLRLDNKDIGVDPEYQKVRSTNFQFKKIGGGSHQCFIYIAVVQAHMVSLYDPWRKGTQESQKKYYCLLYYPA